MSAMRAIRSFRRPYFAFTQGSVENMGQGTLPALGAIEMLVEARMYEAPRRAVSADEIHPLLALHSSDFEVTPINYMAVGVSPNLALVAEITMSNGNNYVLRTGNGAIGGVTDWMSLHLTYDTGTGDIVFDADGATFYDTGSGTIEPAAGKVAQVSMFNGAGAYARINASIRRAYIGWFGSGPESAEWKIASRAIPTEPTLNGLASVDLSLAPARRDFVLLSKPWGESPGPVTDADWAWDLNLNYTKRVIHKPEYVRSER